MKKTCAFLIVALWASMAAAQDDNRIAPAATPPKSPAAEKGKKPKPPSNDNYDDVLQRYLTAARTLSASPMTPDPSSFWMNGLFGDLRARRVNDMVTVHVAESVSASGSADSKLDKNSSATAATPKLFGIQTKFPNALDPTSLAALGATTAFKGSGITTRKGDLTANMTARVAEVLPNGDLAIEGIREIDINGDRQIIVLTGIVRPADISPGNVVPSIAIGQMRIRYFGQGLIKDNLSPGWLVRFINKIF